MTLRARRPKTREIQMNHEEAQVMALFKVNNLETFAKNFLGSDAESAKKRTAYLQKARRMLLFQQ